MTKILLYCLQLRLPDSMAWQQVLCLSGPTQQVDTSCMDLLF